MGISKFACNFPPSLCDTFDRWFVFAFRVFLGLIAIQCLQIKTFVLRGFQSLRVISLRRNRKTSDPWRVPRTFDSAACRFCMQTCKPRQNDKLPEVSKIIHHPVLIRMRLFFLYWRGAAQQTTIMVFRSVLYLPTKNHQLLKNSLIRRGQNVIRSFLRPRLPIPSESLK